MGEKDPSRKRNRQPSEVTGEFPLIDPVVRQMRRTLRSAQDRHIEELGLSEDGAPKEDKPSRTSDEENH
ncbi:hypothetical protein HZB74_01920 [Candidatus Saccharibacteria bacterium]|nr:hypothetical protein [Candidatus Saccharibacteria bacterium]